MNIKNWALNGKTVLLRIDGNVPLNNSTIENDLRLQKMRPTLDYLISQNAQVIIATHIGRPKQQEPELSTKHLVPWFTQQGYAITYAPTLEAAQTLRTAKNPLILLENLRFFSGEQTNDLSFARNLASLADYYVNDAFGDLHRNDTSITLLAQQFPAGKKSFGFLVEHELEELQKLTDHPQKPFLLIVGGKKVEDKLPLIEHLLNVVDDVVFLPALVFTILQAQKQQTGTSYVSTSSIPVAKKLLDQARKNKITIHLPIDYLVAEHTQDGALHTAAELGKDDFGVSIGPKTVAMLAPLIANAGTIFCNGIPGFPDRPETMDSTNALLDMIAASEAYSVIGGGDTTAVADNLGLTNQFGFVSTGGGATLQLLSGVPLPGLIAMQSDTTPTNKDH